MKILNWAIVLLVFGLVSGASTFAMPPVVSQIPGYTPVGEVINAGTRGDLRYAEVQSILRNDNSGQFLILRGENTGTGFSPSQSKIEILGQIADGRVYEGRVTTVTYRTSVDDKTREAAQAYLQDRLEQAQAQMKPETQLRFRQMPASYFTMSTRVGGSAPVIPVADLAANFNGATERAHEFAKHIGAQERYVSERQNEIIRQVDGLTVSLRNEAANRQLGTIEALGNLAAEASHFEKLVQQTLDSSNTFASLPKTDFQFVSPEVRETLSRSVGQNMAARNYVAAAAGLLDIYSPLSKNGASASLHSDSYVDSEGVMRGAVFSPGAVHLSGTPAERHAQLETANYLQAAAFQNPHLLYTPAFRNWLAASYYNLQAGNVELARAIAMGFSPAKGSVRLEASVGSDGGVTLIPGRGTSFSQIIGDEALAQSARRSAVEALLAGQAPHRSLRAFQNLSGSEKTEARFVDRAFARVHTVSGRGQNAVLVGESLLSVAEGDRQLAGDAIKVAETILDVALGFVPVVGTARDIYEAITGTSLVTGEKLTNIERALAVAGVVTLGVITDIERGGKILKGAARLLKTEKGLVEAAGGAEKLVARAGQDLTREAIDGLRRYEDLSKGVIARSLEKSPDTALALGVQVSRMSPEFAHDLAAYQKAKGLDDAAVAILAHSQDGVSKYVTRSSFKEYIERPGRITGMKGSNDVFTVPTIWAERLDSLARGDARVYAEKLGIELKNIDKQELVRIDMPFNFNQNPRLPSGAELGANRFFQPGGFTSGGLPEVIIDAQPLTENIIVKTLGVLK